MKIYKLSLGKDYFDDEQFERLMEEKMVCVHPNTQPSGRSKVKPGKEFLECEKGSLFYVCRSGLSVEYIGVFKDNLPRYSSIEDKADWTEREFEVILKAKQPKNYIKDTQKKWWSPEFRSTFTEVPKGEFNLFEEEILIPAFDQNLNELEKKWQSVVRNSLLDWNDLIAIQNVFQTMNSDETYLFDQINSISNTELDKLYYLFSNLRNIENQPVVFLRLRILEMLKAGKVITSSEIEETKKEIAKEFKKDIFKSWTSMFRILYRFKHIPLKLRITQYLDNLTTNLRNDLGIYDITDKHIVTFDGPQNQGQDRIWLAIYNKFHKSQKTAKQLFINFQFGKIEYGLLDHNDQSNNALTQYEILDYEHLLTTFRSFRSAIIADDSLKDFEMNNYQKLLRLKKQIILQGPPGTGKTHTAKDIAEEMIFGSVSGDKTEQISNLESTGQFELIQFHPSYSYEDFVRGITATTNDEGQISYETENKILVKFAGNATRNNLQIPLTELDDISVKYQEYILEKIERASSNHRSYHFNNDDFVRLLDIHKWQNEDSLGKLRYERLIDGNWVMQTWLDIEETFTWDNYNNPQDFTGAYDQQGLTSVQNDFIAFVDRLKRTSSSYVMIIDEINRANLPSVLGELIYALEYRGEPVQSMYNIKGDNSIILPDNLYIIGTMNTADRSVGHIDYAIKRRFAFVDVLPNIEVIKNEKAKELFKLVSALFVKEDNSNSDHLASDFESKDVQLGHSYFLLSDGSEEDQIEELKMRLNYEILPILNEYVKDGILLESAKEQLKEISGFGN